MTPLVSILVPCYNAGPWVEAALQSALAQTHPRCEIIAVDDGSEDDTAARLETFRSRGVKVIRQTNRGASAARNRALAEATGLFVQFLDADDLLHPEKIAVQVRALEGRPRHVASGAWARFVENPGEAAFTPEKVWRDASPIEFLVDCALHELMFPPSAWLVPRSLCDRAGPWDETLSLNDDGEYMARVLAGSERIVFCPEARTYYRSGNPHSYGSRTSHIAARSDLRAWDSIVATMWALERSPRTARAAATGYQRIQARYYGRYPDIVAAAAARERLFGGGQYRFQGGRLFRAAVRLLGWKCALRLRRAKSALRARL